MRSFSALVCSALLLATTTPAPAQDQGDPAAGRRLVEQSCSDCHGPSSATTRAPSFAAVAAMPSTTALSLGVFLRTSHPTMPNVMLGPADLDNVIAYILSLR
jgi:cytochrome c